MPPLISLVVPMYNEEEGLDAFFTRTIPILDNIAANWEILCINDGSADATAEGIAGWHRRDPRIKLVGLSRNFGKETALTAGLFHASGDAVIPIDADLQDPPELIPEMLAQWRAGYKVVMATRRQRASDSWAKKHSALLFYRIIGRLSRNAIPANTGDFRLLDRSVVMAIRQLPERTRFMKGLMSWVGFPTTHIYYDRPERHAGETKFSFLALWNLGLDGLFSFTTIPLRVWTYLGAAISLLSLFYAIYLILRTLIGGIDVPGYASLMVAILFMGGIQLISLGVLGEYIGRIYKETKRRPLYLLDGTLGLSPVHPEGKDHP